MASVALPATARIVDGGRSRALCAGLVVAGTALLLLLTVRAPLGGGVMPLAAGGLLVAPTWMLVTRRHEHALAGFMLYLGLLDGFLKLSVPTGNEMPGLGRDALLYAVVIGMLVRAIVKRRPFEFPPISGWVVAFVLVAVVQLLNPDNWSALHSVASLRQHIEFVPLFFIGYALMRDPKRLRVFIALMLVITAANAVVSAVQFNMSPDQLSNWGPGYAGLISGESGVAPRTAEGEDGEKRTRPPALGSDMGFGGTLGGIALPLALALLVVTRRQGRRIAFVVPAGLAAVIAVATSQSRTAVIGAFVAVGAFALLALAARRALPVIGTIVVVGAIASLVLSQAQGADSGSFSRYDSIAPTSAVDTTITARRNTFETIPEYIKLYPLGAGIGSVGPAAGVIDPPPKRYLNAESQFTFTLVEVGIPGLVVLIAINFVLVSLIVRNIKKVKDADARLLLAGLAAPLVMFIANWTVGANTPSTPNAPYFWFVAGVLVYWLHPRSVRFRRPQRLALKPT